MATKKEEGLDLPEVEVILMGIDRTAKALSSKYEKTKEEVLHSLDKVLATKRIKPLSIESIPIRWQLGKTLNEDAFKTIESDVHLDDVKKLIQPVLTYAADGKTVLPFDQWEKKTVYFNHSIVKTQLKVKEGELDETDDANFRKHMASLESIDNDIGARKGHFQSEKRAVRSELKSRDAVKIGKMMKERGIKTKSLNTMMRERYGDSVIVPVKEIMIPA